MSFSNQATGNGTLAEPYRAIRTEAQEAFINELMKFAWYGNPPEEIHFILSFEGKEKVMKVQDLKMLQKKADVVVQNDGKLLIILLHMVKGEKWDIAYYGTVLSENNFVVWRFEWVK